MTQQSYVIRPITRPEAKQILSWRYDAPYDFYDPPEPEDIESLLDKFMLPENCFHGVRDDTNRFVGFCSFGLDGQVLGGDYDDGPLDLGLGMKPQETNLGRGRLFFRSIVDFAIQHYGANALRLSVAKFNDRAIRVYQSLGFKTTGEFFEVASDTPYLIMEKAV